MVAGWPPGTASPAAAASDPLCAAGPVRGPAAAGGLVVRGGDGGAGLARGSGPAVRPLLPRGTGLAVLPWIVLAFLTCRQRKGGSISPGGQVMQDDIFVSRS